MRAEGRPARAVPAVRRHRRAAAGTHTVHALVRDDVASVRIALAVAGRSADVPIDRNLASAESGQEICSLTWTTRGGARGTEPVGDPFADGSRCRGHQRGVRTASARLLRQAARVG